MTTTVTEASFETDVIASSQPVLVDFWAEWCGPCRMIAPALEEISREMAGQITVAKLNIDDNPDIAARFGVRSIPTLMIFRDGKAAAVQVGANPKGRILDWIKGALD